jgi:hypothetical protein
MMGVFWFVLYGKSRSHQKALFFYLAWQSKYNAPAPMSNVVADVAAKDTVI